MSRKDLKDTDTPVHQHAGAVGGLAPFLLTGLLHFQEVALRCLNVADLSGNNATAERKDDLLSLFFTSLEEIDTNALPGGTV